VRGLQSAFADALFAGDAAAAERVVREGIEAELPESVIDDEVIAPSMRLVGDLAAGGHLTLADAALATQIASRVLALEREAFRTSRGRAQARVLLAAIEGERHVLGMEMAAGVLAHAGYDVRSLGADVPLNVLGPAVLRHRPAIVGFTVTMPATAALVPTAITQVRRRDARVGVLLGGAGASERMRCVPGVTVCHHVSDVVELADALVHRASLN